MSRADDRRKPDRVRGACVGGSTVPLTSSAPPVSGMLSDNPRSVRYAELQSGGSATLRTKTDFIVYFACLSVILVTYWLSADPPSLYVVALLAGAAVLAAVVIVSRQHPTRRY